MSSAEPTASPKFPMSRIIPFGLPPEYAELRSRCPVSQVTLPSGASAWIITNHEYARQFLADPRLSVNRGHPGFPDVLPRQGAANLKATGMLTWMDPPEHSLHRRMLINEFTVKRIRTMRPAVQKIVDDRIDAMLAQHPPLDLVPALSLPVPMQVISELLGIPEAERSEFDRLVTGVINRLASGEERLAAWTGLRSYLGDLIASKTSDPQDDLLSRLIKKYQQAGGVDPEILIGLAMALRVAGHESTANMISLSVIALLEAPDQLAELKANHALAPQAVEELLRYFSIADRVTSRVATDDIEIGGVIIREGEGVITLNAAANHDKTVFNNPTEFDIHRDSRHHIAFGHGIHQCLGQNIARLELETILTTLFTRIPDLQLTIPAADLSFRQDGSFFGIDEVPVTW